MLHGQDERARATTTPVKRAATSTVAAKAGVTIAANDPVDHRGELKAIGGSTSDAFNSTLANSVINALWVKNSDAAEKQRQFTAAACALVGIAPQDELEGMLAAQLIAANAAAIARGSAPV